MEFSQDFDKDTQLVVAAAAGRRRGLKRELSRIRRAVTQQWTADEAKDFIIWCDDGVGRAREINSWELPIFQHIRQIIL